MSLFLFNVYENDLSRQLNAFNTGCVVGDVLINVIVSADDLLISCVYSAGLLKLCSQYGIDFNIKYNAKKSNIMTVRSEGDRKLIFAELLLSDITLNVSNEMKCFGHYIVHDLSDDKDIHTELYTHNNMLST